MNFSLFGSTAEVFDVIEPFDDIGHEVYHALLVRETS